LSARRLLWKPDALDPRSEALVRPQVVEAGVPPPFVRHPAFFAGFFKIPSLWGVKNTAPYFHDNSAKTLEGIAAFYTNLFANNQDFPVQLTAQDEIDMVAYLKLLR